MNDNITLPARLLRAALSKSDYFDLHRDYTRMYDLSDKKAWEKLENDLEFHGLPNRYTSDRSFYTERHKLVRVNTKS